MFFRVGGERIFSILQCDQHRLLVRIKRLFLTGILDADVGPDAAGLKNFPLHSRPGGPAGVIKPDGRRYGLQAGNSRQGKFRERICLGRLMLKFALEVGAAAIDFMRPVLTACGDECNFHALAQPTVGVAFPVYFRFQQGDFSVVTVSCDCGLMRNILNVFKTLAMLNFDAVIFDMDGVITKTGSVHSLAWRKMFDEYLRHRERNHGEPFREFTHASDYLPYVDGRPRYKGVEVFLESRGIKIPFGTPGDEPQKETICGLGNRKNEFFNQLVEEGGVVLYDSTLKLIAELRAHGVRVGLATSSQNGDCVLKKAGILHLFETRVDGIISAQMGLRGKPDPDIFTTACGNLGASPGRSIVIEDAVSGVQAGMKGRFALVIGIARENNAHKLKANGADIVVEDLDETNVEKINQWVAAKRATPALAPT